MSKMNETIRKVLMHMERIEQLQADLKALLAEKLDAMRRADLHAIQAFVEREKDLIIGINEQEVLRKQAMEQIGAQLGMSKGLGRTITARMLAEHADEPVRSRLLDRVSRLKQMVTEVSKLNRLIQRVSEQTIKHLKTAFATISEAGEDIGLYSAGGTTVQRRPREFFEAIG